jgi:hypothetical protein
MFILRVYKIDEVEGETYCESRKGNEEEFTAFTHGSG